MFFHRYNVEGKQRDTVIAVRELHQDGLGAAQRTWLTITQFIPAMGGKLLLLVTLLKMMVILLSGNKVFHQ